MSDRWQEELAHADKFLASAVKPTGEIFHVEDGKTDIYIRLKYPDMVRLLATYGINTVIRVSGIEPETLAANDSEHKKKKTRKKKQQPGRPADD